MNDQNQNLNVLPEIDYRHLSQLSLQTAQCETIEAFAHLAVKHVASLIVARPILLFTLYREQLQLVATEPANIVALVAFHALDNDILVGAWHAGLPFMGGVSSLGESPLTTLLQSTRITALASVPIRLKARTDGAILCGGQLSDTELHTLVAYAQLIAPHLYHLHQLAQRDSERTTTEIFQRIDRELTETINLSHVFVMMLDWALRFTNASAASIALVNGDNVRFMGNYGYHVSDQELQALRGNHTKGITHRVARSGKTEIVPNIELDSDTGWFPPDIHSQMAVPVIRDEVVIGVITLESRKLNGFTSEHRDFVKKLSERAAYAVDNARLYSETQQEKERLSTILDTIADIVIVIDQAGYVRRISKSAIQALRLYSKQNYVGMSFVDALGFRPLELLYQQSLTSNGIAEELILPNGNTYYVRAIPMQDIGHALVMQDVSPYKKADAFKNDLIATVSHDLKQPLSVMRGYVDLLRMKNEFNEQSTGFVERLERGILHMRHLIDDLLDLARIESEHQLDLSSVNLSTILTDCTEANRSAAEAKATQLSLSLPPQTVEVKGDFIRLVQVFNNLISNAIKYTPPEGQVDINAETKEGVIRVSIKDNGLGISPEDQPHIFDRFYRVRRPETDSIEGTGLGLAIVKKLVDAHKGTIQVDSTLGVGSTFFVTLPMNQ